MKKKKKKKELYGFPRSFTHDSSHREDSYYHQGERHIMVDQERLTESGGATNDLNIKRKKEIKKEKEKSTLGNNRIKREKKITEKKKRYNRVLIFLTVTISVSTKRVKEWRSILPINRKKKLHNHRSLCQGNYISDITIKP